VAPTSAEAGHVRVLDGLRGVAIALVVLAHSGQTGYRPELDIGRTSIALFPFVVAGSLGVEMFFFLSGFVLFLPYARAMVGEGETPTIGHFIDRRFIKIVPSYYLALLATAYFFLQPSSEAPRLAGEVARHLAFVHTFWPESISSISGPFWTLGIEVQFYVLFPLIAACMRRAPVRTYLAMLAVGEGWRLYLVNFGLNEDPYWVSQLPGQIDLFGIGMISAYAFMRLRPYRSSVRVSRVATVVAICAAGATMWFLEDLSAVTIATGEGAHQAWHNGHRLIFGATFAVLALASIFAQAWWRAILGNPLFVWLSVISYNLYLWNCTIVVQCATTGFPCSGSAAPWTHGGDWGTRFFWSYIAISIAIAALVTYGIERPLMRLGTRGLLEGVRQHLPVRT
jgi:peptidoglycan/LPS O-acetylase OafA/YrhL